MPHSRNSALLQVLRLRSLVLLPAWGPAALLRVSAPVVLPLVVPRPDLSLAFRPVAPRAHLRATSQGVRLVSMVLPDCVASITAVRPISAASRVAPRPIAPIATPAIVTSAMATGPGLMRRLLSRDNLDENGASIWVRRGRPSVEIIDAGRRLGKL